MMKKSPVCFLKHCTVTLFLLLIVSAANAGVSYDIVSTGGSASTSYASDSGPASNAFDGDLSSAWWSYGTPQWLRYKLSSKRIVTMYTMVTRSSDYFPTAWYFQGSNDGSNWTTLDTRSGQTNWATNTWKSYTCSNSTAYLYYRIYITAADSYCSYYTYASYCLYSLSINEMRLYSPKVPTATLSRSPTTINIRGTSTLAWSATNVTSVSINNGVGTVYSNSSGITSTSGTKSVSPSTNTTYTLTAIGPGGTATKTATVSIYPPDTAISANYSAMMSGDKLTIGWAATNVTSVSINNGVGSVYYNSSGTVSTNGTVDVYPTVTSKSTITYTVTAVGPGGTDTQSVAVTVYPDITDSDNDGLPDYYEIYTYGNLTSQGVSSGSCDCD